MTSAQAALNGNDRFDSHPGAAESLANARRYLLAQRAPGGFWEGELSTSALSTATAIFSLSLYSRMRLGMGTAGAEGAAIEAMAAKGVAWLVANQNADGGWGDTVVSFSNISTTALCWSAVSAVGETPTARDAVARAAAWLTSRAGSLEPAALARAIIERYGKDHTFSVPILTMCVLAGRLGEEPAAWAYVPQLPFELAACPQSWFRFLKLPVVSYALPALIAIGRVRHANRPTWNPIARAARAMTAGRVMNVLRQIQPKGGGFLEATPLTSFVLMSLCGAGVAGHPVAAEGAAFLIRSVRPDGSWPIDTNLATWVTTLSVNALSSADDWHAVLDVEARRSILDWLLAQQYRVRHPYTGAPPGAWAWTDLPGGVPDADDTAGALVALARLAPEAGPTAQMTDAAEAAVGWLLDLQNSDGGIPTFCRGWGNLPFDRSGADLTGHALLAWSAWRGGLAATTEARIRRGISRALLYLAKTQRADGAWLPLWFGNQRAEGDNNPLYGTARVLIGLQSISAADAPHAATLATKAARWLTEAQNGDGGWGGDRGAPSSIEETALATHALRGAAATEAGDAIDAAIQRGAAWLIERTDRGQRFEPSPIGFYFAKLWYFEKLYAPIFTVAALSRLGEGRQLSDNRAPPRSSE